jgi:hypothetical protein
VGLPGPQAPLSASRKKVTGSNDESELFRSYCAGQLRSRISSMFQKMAKWHMRGVAPFVTLLRASVSQGTGRGPSSVMALPSAIAQSRLYEEVLFF